MMSNTEPRKALPELNIELNVACPYCESYFDALAQSHGIDDLQQQLTPSNGDHWTDVHEKLDETIECPECERDINLVGVKW